MAGGVRVEGLTKVTRALKGLGLDVDDLKDAFATIADEAVERVKRYVPHRSGRLAGDVRGNRAQSKAVVRAGRASIPYAGPVNYGWPARGIEPAEYMQKGDQEMQPIAVRRLEEEIEHRIRIRGL
jgi:hypothetical protein